MARLHIAKNGNRFGACTTFYDEKFGGGLRLQPQIGKLFFCCVLFRLDKHFNSNLVHVSVY